jgi:hypothetical protein
MEDDLKAAKKNIGPFVGSIFGIVAFSLVDRFGGLILACIILTLWMIGVLYLSRRVRRLPEGTELAEYQAAITAIESFLRGSGHAWDWDDFTSIRKKDPYLESIRERCVQVRDDYPPKEPQHYCNPEGLQVLANMVIELRSRIQAVEETDASSHVRRATDALGHKSIPS